MRYRRSQTPGATFFFTVVTYNRKRILCLGENPARLKQAIETVRGDYPFTVDAIVILPDHLHCIWTLPCGDSNFSKRWMLIKSKFTRACDAPFKEALSPSRIKKREQNIWQRRFWEHQIRDDADCKQHIDYIHYNPVKHGLVKAAIDWKFTSFHRYMNNGAYPPDWGANREISLDPVIGNE